MSQNPALQKLVELLANSVRDTLSGNPIRSGKEGLDIFGDRLVQNGLFWTTTVVIGKDGLQRKMEGIRRHKGPEMQNPAHEWLA